MTFLNDVPSILGLYGLELMSALTQAVPINVAYRVSTVVADVVFLAWRAGRRDTMTNLRHVLGPTASTKQVRATARQAMRNYFRVLVEFLSLRKLTRAEIMARMREVRGLEYMERALARGRGVILVGVHHGSWDMAGIVATSYNWSITAVADTYRYPPLNEWIFAPRMAWGGIRILSVREPQTLRQAFKILKRNEILALVVDRPMNGEGIPVRFFDADLSFPQGAAAIALRTGATILPGYFVRRPDNTFMAEILPPVEYTPCGDHQEDVQGLTQALVTRLEEIIRRYPEQWYAFQLLWDGDCQAMERTC
jgi:KDO2-lipid IV(A) lauroyltransferase